VQAEGGGAGETYGGPCSHQISPAARAGKAETGSSAARRCTQGAEMVIDVDLAHEHFSGCLDYRFSNPLLRSLKWRAPRVEKDKQDFENVAESLLRA
jgi:hypothetical protein